MTVEVETGTDGNLIHGIKTELGRSPSTACQSATEVHIQQSHLQAHRQQAAFNVIDHRYVGTDVLEPRLLGPRVPCGYRMYFQALSVHRQSAARVAFL